MSEGTSGGASVRPGAPPAPVASVAAAPSRKGRVVAVLAVVALAAGAYYVRSLGYEDTDDAQIDADISAISPRVGGTIAKVLVAENQAVKAGDLLAELDPADYEVALASAQAVVAQAEAALEAEDPSVSIAEVSNKTALVSTQSELAAARVDLSASEATHQQLRAQLAQVEATSRLAVADRERAATLLKTGALSRAEMDARSTAAEASVASVEALKQATEVAARKVEAAHTRLATLESRLDEVRQNAPQTMKTRRAAVLARKATLDLARAQLQQATLNLGYTKIVAPVGGVVGRKSVHLGDRVQPGQQLMAITALDRVWVTANFRETQMRKMRIGQKATVHVDALDLELLGSVESLPGATGSRYSLFPPENATGNFVKVVQRLPVRIQLQPGQPEMERLRPGMSVEPKVTLE